MSRNTEVYVIGAGGHAKVVVRALQDLGHEIVMVFDDHPPRHRPLLPEISIVGPIERIDEYPRRQTVIAIGDNVTRRCITGWVQVNGRNAISWEKKFAMDVWYVDHWSLRLDLQILLMTALKVLRRDGISASGHATMPTFQAANGNSSVEERRAA